MAIQFLDQSDADGGYRPLSDINVTPFVDVMLVLLIIFMVAAPLMTVSVNVALPKTSAAPAPRPKEPVIVSVDAAGETFIKNDRVPAGELQARLGEVYGNDPDSVVLVRGDRSLSYGSIMEVMGQVSRAGFTKVSLIAEEQGAAGTR